MNAILIACALAAAQAAPQRGFPGTAAGEKPKVEIAWNRLYDVDEVYALLDRLATAHPTLLRSQVIGHSVENRELRVYTLNDPATGGDRDKPAMWVDGNVHGNEVQGAEVVVYLAWYLLENRGSNARVDALLEGSAFYLLPMVNPDGRASWFRDAHNSSSSRSGRQPTDEDGDGLFDEDGPNDLDGDGNIVSMWKHAPGRGTHRRNADEPRVFEPVPANDRGIRGDWLSLGQEGVDDDGDGRVNEDDPGGYDMNRAWPSMWAPEFVQGGAGPYPLYWPETRAIARFLLERPNVAALQSFHNSGGMILRGPGAKDFGEYAADDVRVFDRIGKKGERMLPFYRYMVIWKDLYTVWGGFATWGYEGLGIISFTNEMWTGKRMFPGADDDDSFASTQRDRLFFDETLMSGAGFVDWRPHQHPQYGEILIGGFKKDVGRVPPSFMIEEEAHRNAMFCLEHAEAMPKVVIEELTATSLGGGVVAIDARLRNANPIPTRTARAAEMKIGSPDLVTIRGERLTVLAGGWRTDEFRPEHVDLAEREPERLLLENGIGGERTRLVRWLVRGAGSATVAWRGEKGRAVERTIELP